MQMKGPAIFVRAETVAEAARFFCEPEPRHGCLRSIADKGNESCLVAIAIAQPPLVPQLAPALSILPLSISLLNVYVS